MTNRRRFLELGIGAAAWPGLAPAWEWSSAPAAPAEKLTRLPIYKAIYETTHAAALGFAAHMQLRGVAIHGIDADITSLWFNDLALRWRERPVAIAGLTEPGALFCLERLAWEHRMRVAFRATHTRLPGGAIEHRIRAPETLMPRIDSCLHGEPNWSAAMAELAIRCPLPGTAAVAERAAGTQGGARDPQERPLVSWVIAPVKSA